MESEAKQTRGPQHATEAVRLEICTTQKKQEEVTATWLPKMNKNEGNVRGGRKNGLLSEGGRGERGKTGCPGANVRVRVVRSPYICAREDVEMWQIVWKKTLEAGNWRAGVTLHH